MPRIFLMQKIRILKKMIRINISNLKNCLIAISLNEFFNAKFKAPQKVHNNTGRGVTAERAI